MKAKPIDIPATVVTEATAGQMGAAADALEFERDGANGADWNCFRDGWKWLKGKFKK